MNIGLIDVDMESRKKCTFPNLALMKISSWHKAHGDNVEWYMPSFVPYDRVYVSKVFSDEYTAPYCKPICANEIVWGGSGYAIKIENGKEVYHPELDVPLSEEIDKAFPDYSLYGIKDTAYGFLTKGCPRGCAFCHVAGMQGRKVHTVTRLEDFWNGQKKIVLMDPNITASPDWNVHMRKLKESNAWVDFSQGLDIRLLTEKKIDDLNSIKWKRIHFAWDNPKDDLAPKFRELKSVLKHCNRARVSCYVLTNFDSTHEEDLYRIQILRECDIQPYVMIYRKDTAPKKTRRLQRWCSPIIFWKTPTFDEYDTTQNFKQIHKENEEMKMDG